MRNRLVCLSQDRARHTHTNITVNQGEKEVLDLSATKWKDEHCYNTQVIVVTSHKDANHGRWRLHLNAGMIARLAYDKKLSYLFETSLARDFGCFNYSFILGSVQFHSHVLLELPTCLFIVHGCTGCWHVRFPSVLRIYALWDYNSLQAAMSLAIHKTTEAVKRRQHPRQ